MASSDDEGEAIPQTVTNYHFADEKDEPISFAVLPVRWDENESPSTTNKRVFLHGTAEVGVQKIYKQVIEWKLELSDEQPAISVLTKENNWIKLLKPRKSFEETIRTILITVHCLHFAKKNPEVSDKALWDYLQKIFSVYEERPSENDLSGHIPLISEIVKRDELLAKVKVLPMLLNPKKRKAADEVFQTGSDAKKSKFIVDDEDEEAGMDLGDGDADESDEEPDLFDSVCYICDNGGELLCCEGRCLRSFHASKDAGADSDCKSLGMSKAQVKAIQNFLCLNCQFKQHQCFACGKLGSSDKSSGAEVFPCVSATCGHFYHPECVAKLLYPDDEAKIEEHQKKIAAGESFTCPVHKCLVCKQGENKENRDMQFAMCRRCPRAYHRKCLPRKIAFEDSEDEDIVQRAWDDLIPNRILIYCLKHKIDEDLGTPKRNHIIFPEIAEKKRVRAFPPELSKERVLTKKKSVVSEESPREKAAMKLPKRNEVSSAGKETDPSKKSGKLVSVKVADSGKTFKTPDPSKKPLKDGVKPVPVKEDKQFRQETSKLLVKEEKLTDSELVKSRPKDAPSKVEKTVSQIPVAKSSSQPVLDSEAEKKILSLIKKCTSSLTLEDIVAKHRVPSTHSYSSRNLDKTITQGKVEGSVEAVRTALQKLEEGCSIEDAKAVCEPEILTQIMKWKNKLKVYLAPFLHGLRYTSFGRHFTKVDKLKEIVDKLHWYVQNGDMIVDFCCGANDFSGLMKEKIEETGKKCLFKNYDVIQPKNDFCFEKRDWMTVRPKELPTGSRLIMGLNPPFGVKAALANKFIDKALEFKPKLLVLIVPRETERLDEKKEPYELIWEDVEKLSGKSFYLPGSVDINDKQMEQWNLKPPLLYLWSRPDWTSKHRSIAIKQGHASKEQGDSLIEENHKEAQDSDTPREEDRTFYGDLTAQILNELQQQKDREEVYEETRMAVQAEELKESPPRPKHESREDDSKKKEGHVNGPRKKSTRENQREREDKGKQARRRADTPGEEHKDSSKSREIDWFDKDSSPRIDSPSKLSPNRMDSSRSLLEGRTSEPFSSPADRAGSEEIFRGFQLGRSVSGSEFGAGYRGTQTSVREEDLDDIARRYTLNKEDTFASGAQRWQVSSGLGSLEYGGTRGLEQRFPGYMKENEAESFSRRPYIDKLDEKYGRPSADVELNPMLFGRQGGDDLSQNRYLYGNQDNARLSMLGTLSSPFGLSGSGSGSSIDRMNTSSALQRYAPRLDEMSFSRGSPFGTDPSLGGRSSIFDSAASRSSFHGDSLGFASGPQHPYSHQNSSGWLNED